MAALFADENVPAALVVALRSLGHDVLTALEAGRANQRIPDPDVLLYATSLTRAVLTANRTDFRRLHRLDPFHAGIIAFSMDNDVVALAGRIHNAITGQSDLSGQLLRVNLLP